jgi:hypothetical protein
MAINKEYLTYISQTHRYSNMVVIQLHIHGRDGIELRNPNFSPSVSERSASRVCLGSLGGHTSCYW